MAEFGKQFDEDEDSDEATFRSMFAPDHALKQDHPELYGRLLIANEKVENVGTLSIWLMLAFVLGACVTIQMAWIDTVLGVPVQRLQGWGVYALIAVVSFVIYCIYTHFAEKAAFRNVRQPIIQYLNSYNLSVPWLIAQIENDSSVSDVAEQLKSDSSSIM